MPIVALHCSLGTTLILAQKGQRSLFYHAPLTWSGVHCNSRCWITVDVDVYFCVNAHNDEDDVEGVEEIDVDHLEVGRLGNHLPDACLHGGHDQQAGDADHDSVL